MNFFTGLIDELVAMRDLLGEAPSAAEVPGLVERLEDSDVVALLDRVSRAGRGVESVKVATAGVIAARSTRASGSTGLAQSRGFANPVKLVQQATGVGRAEAARQVRVGESLYEPPVPATPPASAGPDDDTAPPRDPRDPDDVAASAPTIEPWHAPLRRALLAGGLSSAQHDTIRRGLGEPPEHPDPAVFAAGCEVWRVAATDLIAQAEHENVEELGKSARSVRDHLDPEGAEMRYLHRYEQRSFRLWTDRDGLAHASLTLDDMSAAWLRGVLDSALKPRRGGPRFMTDDERAKAESLRDDPRTNEQLAYDLVMDVLRSGTLADVAEVHGVRQAGVRVVTIVDGDPNDDGSRGSSEGSNDGNGAIGSKGGSGATDGGASPNPGATDFGRRGERHARAFLEETGDPIPLWEAEREACGSGRVPVTTDRTGNPLDVGREGCLYTSKQRIGLAIRDGGCRWPGCDRPPSYCEAHHIDEWQHGGQTDIDRGISLCRFHHLQLHNGGWRIGRDTGAPQPGAFLLHPPTPSPGHHAPVGRNAHGAVLPPAEVPPSPARAPLLDRHRQRRHRQRRHRQRRHRSHCDAGSRPATGGENSARRLAASGARSPRHIPSQRRTQSSRPNGTPHRFRTPNVLRAPHAIRARPSGPRDPPTTTGPLRRADSGARIPARGFRRDQPDAHPSAPAPMPPPVLTPPLVLTPAPVLIPALVLILALGPVLIRTPPLALALIPAASAAIATATATAATATATATPRLDSTLLGSTRLDSARLDSARLGSARLQPPQHTTRPGCITSAS